MDAQNNLQIPRRILIVDDTEPIHADYRSILSPPAASEESQILEALDSLIFDQLGEPKAKTTVAKPSSPRLSFDLSHAFQGEEALSRVIEAKQQGHPFCLAFVDMRMPPGWDGLETIERIWEADERIQIVICTAYSDHDWPEISGRLGQSDRFMILKKPFDTIEVLQLATALSEKWTVEQRSRALTCHLEKLVEQRTSELQEANRKLSQLNQDLEIKAEEANCAARAKGRFLATMSHEIRTTLNGIMGASHMLSQAELPPQDREFAEIIHSSGESLMAIINDILDYSKYESGQLELEEIPFDPKRLGEECVALTASIAQKHKVSLSFESSPELPEQLLGDPGRIRQIILNLLSNALKFGRNGPVFLRMSHRGGAGAKPSFMLEVQDEGIGMSPETVNQLFKAFMQADSSTTRRFGGTGLGLAICKLLADAMKAEIQVQSALGKGTSFRLSIPLREPRTETKASEQPTANASGPDPAEPAAEERKADYAGKKVLLVDDNPVNRKLARHFLRSLKLETTFAGNGEEAVSHFEKTNFDLILMDLQMPVLDGYGATRAIRALESQRPDCEPTPIIALTANAFGEIRETCLAAGMNDFLTKPLRMKELAVIANRWLDSVSN